jgi:hypothetical protein
MHGRPQCSPEPLQSVREHPPDRVDGTLHRDSCRSSEPAHGPRDEVEPVGVVMGRTPGDLDGAEAGTRDGSARSVDDQQWIEGLSRTGAAHERTCEELHEILFRAARREARQRALYLRVAGPDLDDLACQAATARARLSRQSYGRNFPRHTRAPTSRPRHGISPGWSCKRWIRTSLPDSARCFSV